PEDLVEISTNEQLITTIKSGNANFTLNGQSSNEYPNLPLTNTETNYQLKKQDLKSLIKQTVFAVSTMETRPILTGVHVTLENDKITFTATDSHRLAQRNIVIDKASTENTNYVIPGKSLLELDKIIDESDDLINITMLDNQVLFHTD